MCAACGSGGGGQEVGEVGGGALLTFDSVLESQHWLRLCSDALGSLSGPIHPSFHQLQINF